MNSIRLKAYAKINLGLDVLGKREDGYHNVRMIMQTIGIYDSIIMKKLEQPEIKIKTNLSFLPVNENNLVHKAVKLLKDEFDIRQGVMIKLTKFIPVAAGMAGGSSDAAAALLGMNKLFKLRLSEEQLMERGVKIGADVPYCIIRGTALAEGIGEDLTKLEAMPACFVVVAKPAISVSTKNVYASLDLNGVKEHPDIDGIKKGISEHSLKKIADSMGNVLENVTAREYPIIHKIKQDMKNCGALNAIMSGSGPTVFGLFNSKEKAEICRNKLETIGAVKQIYVTHTYN